MLEKAWIWTQFQHILSTQCPGMSLLRTSVSLSVKGVVFARFASCADQMRPHMWTAWQSQFSRPRSSQGWERCRGCLMWGVSFGQFIKTTVEVWEWKMGGEFSLHFQLGMSGLFLSIHLIYSYICALIHSSSHFSTKYLYCQDRDEWKSWGFGGNFLELNWLHECRDGPCFLKHYLCVGV